MIAAALLTVLSLLPTIGNPVSGNAAPRIEVDRWVGERQVVIDDIVGSKTIVIAFWKTWCAGCIHEFAVLSELQEQYKAQGLIVLAITSMDPENTEKRVLATVEQYKETIRFPVGIDHMGETYRKYIESSGDSGYPRCAIIDSQGGLAWTGHPWDGLKWNLESILEAERSCATISTSETKALCRASARLDSALRRLRALERIVRNGDKSANHQGVSSDGPK